MFYRLLQIIGSLGLFLFGMRIMSEGLQKTAGNRLQHVLNFMTANRFSAVFTGFATTSLIQSSSATTVMVVSFVNAGLLSLTQAVGVIMGANIGTTVTGWIVAILGFSVDIAAVSLPAIGIGVALLLIQKLENKSFAELIIGFGLLFLGLSLLKDNVPDIKNNITALEFITNFTERGVLSYFIFIGVGTVLTVILQSSSAAMAITLAMAYTGWIDFTTSAAIILGENIGTTITANLASIGTNINSRRAARAHTLFNLFGILWMTAVFPFFIRFVDFLVPGPMDEVAYIPAHLAMFHTVFNISNTLICIGFVSQFARLTEKLVIERKEMPAREIGLQYIHTGLQEVPELHLYNAKAEIAKLGTIVAEMFDNFVEILTSAKADVPKLLEKTKQYEDNTDIMKDQITEFLIECSTENLTESSLKNVNAMINITNELERIGDSCLKAVNLLMRKYNKTIKIGKKEINKISEYTNIVQEFLEFNRQHLNNHLTEEEYKKAYKMEKRINSYQNELRKEARKRIKTGSSVKSELLYIDILRHVEHIGDFSLNIARSLTQIH